MEFPGGASDKESACQYRKTWRCRFDPWVRKIPWRKKRQPTPVFLPGKSHQKSLVDYNPQGQKESDMTEETKHSYTGTVAEKVLETAKPACPFPASALSSIMTLDE